MSLARTEKPGEEIGTHLVASCVGLFLLQQIRGRRQVQALATCTTVGSGKFIQVLGQITFHKGREKLSTAFSENQELPGSGSSAMTKQSPIHSVPSDHPQIGLASRSSESWASGEVERILHFEWKLLLVRVPQIPTSLPSPAMSSQCMSRERLSGTAIYFEDCASRATNTLSSASSYIRTAHGQE